MIKINGTPGFFKRRVKNVEYIRRTDSVAHDTVLIIEQRKSETLCRATLSGVWVYDVVKQLLHLNSCFCVQYRFRSSGM